MSEVTTKTIAKVNNVDIIIIQNGDKYVPVKPICEALGIAANGQIERIKQDEILGSTSKLVLSVGGDKKEREMFSIPFKFIFGWLFTIDTSRVKPEAKEAIIKYKLACYDALYRHFTLYADFVEHKQKAIDEQLEKCEDARFNFKNAKNILDEANQYLTRIRKLTIEDYDADSKQLKLFTDEEQKG